MNNCSFLGRLTTDPEMKYFESGKCACNFTIAINEGKDKTTFLDIVAWEKTGELIGEYFKKGSMIGLECRANKETWETAEGEKRSKIKFVVNRVHFVEKKNEASN